MMHHYDICEIYTCENMHKLKMKNCVNAQNHYYWKESIINELKFNVCKAVVIIMTTWTWRHIFFLSFLFRLLDLITKLCLESSLSSNVLILIKEKLLNLILKRRRNRTVFLYLFFFLYYYWKECVNFLVLNSNTQRSMRCCLL